MLLTYIVSFAAWKQANPQCENSRWKPKIQSFETGHWKLLMGIRKYALSSFHSKDQNLNSLHCVRYIVYITITQDENNTIIVTSKVLLKA